MKADRKFWAENYAILSEFYKKPTKELAEDVQSGSTFDYFEEVFEALAIKDKSVLNRIKLKGDVLAKLTDEYTKIFIGPLPPFVIPVESTYKRWSVDPDCKVSIATEKGYLMGDSAVDMIKRYQLEGLVIPDDFSSMPDHIALELEYMSHLCSNGTYQQQKEFLNKHLDWVDELVEEIKQMNDQGFYAAGAMITLMLVKAQQSMM
jgi:TorA maturation chaperone TorD